MTNSGLLNSRGLPRARLLDTGPKARLLDFAQDSPARPIPPPEASAWLGNVPDPADVLHARMLMAGFRAGPQAETVNRLAEYDARGQLTQARDRVEAEPRVDAGINSGIVNARPQKTLAGIDTRIRTPEGRLPPSMAGGVPPPIGTLPENPEGPRLDSGVVRNVMRVRPPPENPPPPYDARLVPNREEDLKRPQVRAFLDAVSRMEGAGYHTVIGNNKFPLGRLAADLDQFPNRGPADHPTASGAYQILEDVYDDLAHQMGLKGFDPRTQDLMAAQLLQRANGGKPGNTSALEALRAGDFDKAVELAKIPWPSLPGGSQPSKIADQMRAIYEERLKMYNAQPPQPLR